MATKRLLYIGDACCPTGFSTVNEAVIRRIDQKVWGKPFVLAINHNGDPHPLGEVAHIYPARTMSEQDPFGVNRFVGIVATVKPDVIIAHQDAWIIAMYLKAAKLDDQPLPPMIAWCPPDAENQRAGKSLNDGIAHVVCPSKFGVGTLRLGGYQGPMSVIRYAPDPIFAPADRTITRKALGVPEITHDAFFFGRADRNAVRKRYDLTMQAFGMWWREYGQPDAYLYLHCAPRDVGYDLIQLAEYFGLGDSGRPRVIFTSHGLKPTAVSMLPRSHMPLIYNMWNAHLSTAMGEGGGLVALESAACGVPQILPRSSSLAEWFDDAAEFVDPKQIFVHTGGINTVGRVVLVEDVVESMQKVYSNRAYQDELRAKALARAGEFSWDTVGQQINTLLLEVAS